MRLSATSFSRFLFTHVLALILPLFLLAGCEFLPQAMVPKNQIPIYSQNTPVTVLNPIALSIKRCYWTDEFEKAGFENLPEQMKERQRHLFVVKPQAKFLVVEIEAVNTGTAPAQWSQIQPPVFALENTAGATFVCEGADINEDDFGGEIMQGRGVINPSRSLPGKLLFDVAPGDYTLNFGLTSYYQAGSYQARGYKFKWRLAPLEGK